MCQIQRALNEAKVLDDADVKKIDDAEDPACCPVYWVSKWVDYSDKYGLGYQLCDNSSGVVYNDVTRLLITANNQNLQYIKQDGSELFYTISDHPESLKKKITLLNYFKDYMQDNLLKVSMFDEITSGFEFWLRPVAMPKMILTFSIEMFDGAAWMAHGIGRLTTD